MFLKPLVIQQENKMLDEAVDQITESSIKLAEATANYGALKIVFSIFIVFMILIVILFIYQIITLTKKIDTIHTAATRTQEYFEGVSDSSIGDNEAQVIIRRSMNSLCQSIKYYILRIRLENHIENKILIEEVDRVVKNEFSELTNFLGNFINNEKQLSGVVNTEDIDVIKQFVLEQVYIPKSEFTISNMDQSTSILINGLKLNYIKNL